jgi:hypothetical protein
MKRFVANFSSFSRINENEEDFDTKLKHLRRLVDLGLIPQSEIKAALRKQGTAAMLSTDEIYSGILESPELEDLKALGLEIVSSPVQLSNRTLVIGYPGYTSRNQFAIGFYPAGFRIKRLTPQKISMGQMFRTVGEMDQRIKQFPEGSFRDDLDFYRKAMRWSLDHLDFTEKNYYSNSPYFPVKTRTRRGYLEGLD